MRQISKNELDQLRKKVKNEGELRELLLKHGVSLEGEGLKELFKMIMLDDEEIKNSKPVRKFNDSYFVLCQKCHHQFLLSHDEFWAENVKCPHCKRVLDRLYYDV